MAIVQTCMRAQSLLAALREPRDGRFSCAAGFADLA
jgi:hypothetical protein